MSQITIPLGELGVTRVFSLSMNPSEARALRDNHTLLAAALGADPQNAAGIEVFALTDLGELGLVGLLREGVDAHPKDIARDEAKLAALDGWVLLVHSLAYAQDGATLDPIPAMTLIGTYGQTATTRPPVALEAETAKPYTGTPSQPPAAATHSKARGSWVVVALALMATVILWIVLR